jgi:hypothetical protein
VRVAACVLLHAWVAQTAQPSSMRVTRCCCCCGGGCGCTGQRARMPQRATAGPRSEHAALRSSTDAPDIRMCAHAGVRARRGVRTRRTTCRCCAWRSQTLKRHSTGVQRKECTRGSCRGA